MSDPSSSPDTQAEIAAVEAIWPQYCAALIDGDIERWASLWIDDGVQMPPDIPAVLGTQNIRAGMQQLLDLYAWDISINPDETRVTGNWAFSRGNYSWAWTPKAEGEKMAGTGKFLTIFQKLDDGSWKIARDCFNGNGPAG